MSEIEINKVEGVADVHLALLRHLIAIGLENPILADTLVQAAANVVAIRTVKMGESAEKRLRDYHAVFMNVSMRNIDVAGSA